MTIEECKKLQEGDEVCWKLNHNTTQIGRFIRMGTMRVLKPIDFDGIMKCDFNEGRTETAAVIEYVDDFNIKRIAFLRPRKIQRYSW